MMDIRQYLVIVSDDGLTVRGVELTTPPGMRVQLTEGDFYGAELPMRLSLRLPILYEGHSREQAFEGIK